jgi:hypothetical protein
MGKGLPREKRNYKSTLGQLHTKHEVHDLPHSDKLAFESTLG